MKAQVLVLQAALCLASLCSLTTTAIADNTKPAAQKQPASHIVCDLRSCRVIKAAPETKHTPSNHTAQSDDRRHKSASPPR